MVGGDRSCVVVFFSINSDAISTEDSELYCVRRLITAAVPWTTPRDPVQQQARLARTGSLTRSLENEKGDARPVRPSSRPSHSDGLLLPGGRGATR